MFTLLWHTACFFSVCRGAGTGFAVPAPAARAEAVGHIEDLPEFMRRAFSPTPCFEPIPAPNPGDWLAEHPEPGQSFPDFIFSNPNLPDSVRHVIYLQPLGEFGLTDTPLLRQLREVAAAFFRKDTVLLPARELKPGDAASRINAGTGKPQRLTGDLLKLLFQDIPSDAFCVLGITMEDLYPEPSWNFVFGQASLSDRVGVYSLARYDPAFYGEARGSMHARIRLLRAAKVLLHETGHMFGMQHCIYYCCLMNGSNHLKESDDQPLHLCPVCLRKLHHSVGFDIVERYRALLRFCRDAGLNDEAQWTQYCVEWILAGPAS